MSHGVPEPNAKGFTRQQQARRRAGSGALFWGGVGLHSPLAAALVIGARAAWVVAEV